MSKTCLIVDLDGTLALNDHRQHFLQKSPKDWGAFFDACGNDQPNDAVIEVVRRLISGANSGDKPLRVYILSGRVDTVMEETKDWLARYVTFDYELHMRPGKDRSDDVDLKREMAAKLGLTPENVLAVIDDRNSVVKMWREMGFTVLQVNDHDF